MKMDFSHKLLAFCVLILLIIVAGTNGFLPLFSNTEAGRSHSLLAPLAALLDIVMYLSAAIVIILAGFDIYEKFRSKRKVK
ncbi:MAG: hypothetical protein KF685_06050 [Acidobacteria bacterium]|nr:hypothetical protein [Acidobacteriota bacterium]